MFELFSGKELYDLNVEFAIKYSPSKDNHTFAILLSP